MPCQRKHPQRCQPCSEGLQSCCSCNSINNLLSLTHSSSWEPVYDTKVNTRVIHIPAQSHAQRSEKASQGECHLFFVFFTLSVLAWHTSVKMNENFCAKAGKFTKIILLMFITAMELSAAPQTVLVGTNCITTNYFS